PLGTFMLKKKSTRRFLSVLLILIGATLIFLATQAWVGVLLVVLGITVELVGIAMRHGQE
ncbi:MAG: hypothetical protein U1C59_07130, partial [Methylotenera sp.]|nr:hypothetical protein [Methylotenera sp.]